MTTSPYSGYVPLARGVDVAAGTAAVTTISLGRSNLAGVVTEVSMVADIAEALEANNFITLQVVNKGQAGAGATVVASRTNNNTGGTVVTPFVPNLFTLSATPANLVLADGDVLVLVRTAATGVSTQLRAVVGVKAQRTV